MRTKTRGVKRRLSISPRKQPSSIATTSALRPLPLYLDGDDYDAVVEDCADRIASETSNQNHDDNNIRQTHNVASDNMNVNKKKKGDLDPMEVDWSEGFSCIKCNRSGQLLVCCQIDCPISLHAKCMPCEPKFDAVGKFYCPYCWYKRELARTQELRKKAMLAKKALSDFIDLEMIGGVQKKKNDGAQGNDANVNSFVGQRNYGECLHRNETDANNEVQNGFGLTEEGCLDDGLVAKPVDNNQSTVAAEHPIHSSPSIVEQCDNMHVSQEKKIAVNDLPGDSSSKENTNDQEHQEGMPEENNEQVGDYQDEGPLEENDQVEDLNAQSINEETTAEWPLHGSADVKCRTTKASSENQGTLDEEDQMQIDEQENTVSNTGENAAAVVPETSNVDNERVVVHQKNVKKRYKMMARRTSGRLQASLRKNAANENGKDSPSKRSRQSKEPAKKVTNLSFPNEKRKRLFWTAEEEEMLKEGVGKFSTEVNKNIPWRKILEFGHHIFDTTRTPADLKDKWRNMMAKDPSIRFS